MKKTLLSVLALFLFATVILAGCAKSNDTDTDSKAASSPAATNSTNQGVDKGSQTDTIDQPVTLTIVDGGGTKAEQLDEQFGNAVRKKFPNVTIKYLVPTNTQRLPEFIAAGENIDIYIRMGAGVKTELTQYNMQYDISNLMKKYNVDTSNLEPSVMDSLREMSDGGLWGLPVFSTNLVMYYNKDLFDKFGVDYPKNGMSWDQIIQLSEKMNRQQDGQIYAGVALWWGHMLMNNYSLAYYDPKTGKSTYDNPKWKNLYGIQTKLAQNPIYGAFMQAKGGKVPDSKDFTDGKAAMLGTIQTHVGSVEFARPDFHWDMVSWPVFDDNPGFGSQLLVDNFTIPSFAKNKDAAVKVLKYLISDEYQTELSKKGIMPVSKTKAVQEAYGSNGFKDKNNSAAFFNKPAPIQYASPYDDEIRKAATTFEKDIYTGKMDINTAMTQAKDIADKKIAEMKVK